MSPAVPKPKRPNQAAKDRAEFNRKYGSPERAEWVKTEPCAACKSYGCENAHVMGNGGYGRKKDYLTVTSLCDDRFGRLGCHTMFDRHRDKFDAKFPAFDPAAACAETQRRYVEHTDGREW